MPNHRAPEGNGTRYFSYISYSTTDQGEILSRLLLDHTHFLIFQDTLAYLEKLSSSPCCVSQWKCFQQTARPVPERRGSGKTITILDMDHVKLCSGFFVSETVNNMVHVNYGSMLYLVLPYLTWSTLNMGLPTVEILWRP